MKLLFAVAEANPFIKVGGLADVAGSLPRALARLGHEVRLVMPLYGAVDRQRHSILATDLRLRVQGREREHQVDVWQGQQSGAGPAYFLDCPDYFAAGPVYGQPNDLDRFLLFSRAVAALVRSLDWQPDVVHAHDWHAALVPVLLRRETVGRRRPGTVLTIHNLAYQGWFDYAWATAAGLVGYIPGKEDPLHPLLWRCLGLGIYDADAVSTVSETYAKEVLTPEYGEGLERVLQHRRQALFGIVNGLDEEEFDPARDPHIVARYTARTVSQKSANKRDLQAQFGLAQEAGVPLLGNVGRLAEQKGVGILTRAVAGLLERGTPLQAVFLGSGEPEFRKPVEELAAKYPGKVGLRVGFDNALAHKIYAGCDLFLMPSKFEPCGLGQLIAMTYGTVPVVRRTGGLADTVREDSNAGTGFVFDEFTPGALAAALERALHSYGNPDAWRKLVRRAMAQDFSWDRSAAKYVDLYGHALARAQA